jgi:hypothetical protein
MDHIKILKRAWHILWQYRTLWIFGLILALTAAGSSGSSGSSNSSNYSFDSRDYQSSAPLPDNIVDFFTQVGEDVESAIVNSMPPSIPIQEEWDAVMWVIIAFVAVMILTGLVMTFLRYISETALIRMVDTYEASDTKMSIREGFRTGWSRTSWRLFLINLLVSLPAMLLFAGLVILGFVIFGAYLAEPAAINPPTILGIVVLSIIAIFVIVVISVFLDLLRHFFWREAALQNLGVMDSIKSGFAMVKKNWKSIGTMWLIMIGLSIAWAIVSTIAFFILIPVMVITAAAGAVVSALPALLLSALFGTFLHGWLPWIMAGLFVLPLFLTIASSPLALLTAWEQVFSSSVWTLTYRELIVVPAIIDTEPVLPLPNEA